MGALPSRETQRRGLYSHRHGRNRRNEILLIPLTAEFFPDVHCPLFERLYQARHQRTAKYYYRSVRPANTDRDSDFCCQTVAHALNIDLEDPDGPNKDGVFEKSFSDTIEGLYQRLVAETEYCMCETDEELRQRYVEQLREQQSRGRGQQRPFSDGVHEEGPGVGLNMYVSGYKDAVAYMQGKEQHTHRNKNGTHVTSPAAFYLRPVPCAIVSRFDAQRPHADEGVEFLGLNVKVLGMFGLFPATIPITCNGETVEQHMLKSTMFVDKDVGDQILGNVVMLAVHMYVRQCMEARIRAPYIPMVPFIFRAPVSNIPMLQFVREMRVRLQGLLDAGTPRSDKCPGSFGPSSGRCTSSAARETTGACDESVGREGTDMWLFEEDVPNCTSLKQLFAEASELKWLLSPSSQNTNFDAALPILMMSGVNVQATPLKHSSLCNLSHVQVPPWAASAFGDNSATGRPRTAQHSPQLAAQLLARRRSRFRIWIEDGRLCIWASAAYARRGCLILAQQLSTTVDGVLFPLPRLWNYRGLLRSGMPVPAPKYINDVVVVEHDMPSVGLYQGDLLRCSLEREVAERQLHQRQGSAVMTPLTPGAPFLETFSSQRSSSKQGVLATNESTNFPDPPNSVSNHMNSHSSNIFSQNFVEAPPGAFWVNVPYIRGDRAPACFERRRRRSTSEAQQYGDVLCRQTNIEEVLLSWMKATLLQTRDGLEAEHYWVRDPATREPVCVDRYLIRRVEHDGVRYFVGVAPRFGGQQRGGARGGPRETGHNPQAADGDEVAEGSAGDGGSARERSATPRIFSPAAPFGVTASEGRPAGDAAGS